MIKIILRTLRVHQYAKNFLIFIPMILGHEFMNLMSLNNCIAAFASFSLLASCVYIINDKVDIESDREHRTKKNRPIASGAISDRQTWALLAVCFIVSIVIALFLPRDFQLVLVAYFILTLLYSFYLKEKLLIDVILLSSLYTVRLIAGVMVVGSGISEWLLLFSLFIFTSLAFLKRYTELYFAKKENINMLKGRSYHVEHISVIQMFGVASGLISVLVFALYLNSDKAFLLYHTPILLYLICPLLTYWICRIWLLASEGLVHEDPVLYAIKDKASYIIVFIILLIGIAAAI